MSIFADPGAVAADPALRDRVVIAGIGTTDFVADYRSTARGNAGSSDDSVESMLVTAFHNARVDAGLEPAEIDGLVLCVPDALGEAEVRGIATRLGLTPRHLRRDGYLMAGVLPRAVTDLARGRCRTLALVYVGTRRRSGATFGGPTSRGGPASYSYFHPWGWSSQAAHWALIFQRYMQLYDVTEADLGAVAVTLRRNAAANDNAIMRQPLDLDGYLASRSVVRPLRVLDLCLVSDGGVGLILTGAEAADNLRHPAVHVSGWGDARVGEPKFDYLVKQRLRPLFQESAAAAFAMAGWAQADVDLFEGYDSSSVHLLNQVEGYGFVDPGTALRHWAGGAMEISGRLPVNTNGGMLSEAFMHGWTQVVEVVRQLRHEAGVRQVAGARRAMSSVATTDSAHPLLFTRGA